MKLPMSITFGANASTLFPEHDLPINVNQALSEGQSLNVRISDEGVIIDAFDGVECVGTVGMTFDEWHESLR